MYSLGVGGCTTAFTLPVIKIASRFTRLYKISLIHLILSGKVVLQLNVYSPITWFVIYLLLVAYICCLALVMNFWSKSQNTGSVFTAGKFYSSTYSVYTGIFNVSRWRDLVELEVLIFSLFLGKAN